MNMKGDAYGGRRKGVKEGFVEAAFAEGPGREESEDSDSDAESESCSSLDSSFEDVGSWRKRMAAGSTEIISPGARRVLASVCFLPFSRTEP